MKRSYLVYLVIGFLFCLDFSSAATIHGNVYDPSFNLLSNVQVEINTTPKQNNIAKNGVYFFFTPVGVYEITAEKFYQGELIYSTKKIIEVDKDGEFNIDIVLTKVSNITIVEDNSPGPSIPVLIKARYGYLFPYLISVGLFFLLIIVSLVIWGLKRKTPVSPIPDTRADDLPVHIEPQITIEHTDQSLVGTDSYPNESGLPLDQSPTGAKQTSEDLDSVLNIIKEEGGRTTQKDIRKKIPLSEAKISLMISELEAMGKVQKIKKGRGNIILLKQ